jgi:toxin HigB-1
LIGSFRCPDTEKLANYESVRRFRNIEKVAVRKLDQLKTAVSLADVRIPPANRLEKLEGNRKGQWSIRINDQYRVCFVWVDGAAWDVDIVDYH